ncbi:MAG: hypothetical protein IJM44_00970 [Ruminococcus sp.]|nr:hypothetical protein [Ruminococcus sp.]
MAAFYNQATLSYNGTIASSNITVGEMIEVLSAEKNAVSGTYTPGGENVFVISLVNSGSAAFTDITITDDLGAYAPSEGAAEVVPLTYVEGTAAYYVNGVLQTAPTVAAESPLTITGISVPAGGSALVLYAARANEFAPPTAGSSMTNTAEISGTGFTALTASAETAPAGAPDLAISKSLSPTQVEENGEVTYTFIIQNYGNTEASAEDSVIFSDTFTPVLNGLTAQFNGAAWTAGTDYTYAESTGEFVSTAGSVTVPAATYTQDPDTGAWAVQPGVSTLVITGTI